MIQPVPDVQASIGPCPFKHGKEPTRGALKLGGLASIGPCPFKHGKRP